MSVTVPLFVRAEQAALPPKKEVSNADCEWLRIGSRDRRCLEHLAVDGEQELERAPGPEEPSRQRGVDVVIPVRRC